MKFSLVVRLPRVDALEPALALGDGAGGGGTNARTGGSALAAGAGGAEVELSEDASMGFPLSLDTRDIYRCLASSCVRMRVGLWKELVKQLLLHVAINHKLWMCLRDGAQRAPGFPLVRTDHVQCPGLWCLVRSLCCLRNKKNLFIQVCCDDKLNSYFKWINLLKEGIKH